jgi:hypothetical protein
MGRRTHYTHCRYAALFFRAFSLGEAFQVDHSAVEMPQQDAITVFRAVLLCPSGRSVLAGGSGSTAAYASHYALRDGGGQLCILGLIFPIGCQSIFQSIIPSWDFCQGFYGDDPPGLSLSPSGQDL